MEDVSITEVDMEAARQLVQLSEGDTITISSSGSCNSKYYHSLLNQKNETKDDKSNRGLKEKNNDRAKKQKTDEDEGEILSFLSEFPEVAGEIEDDGDEDFVNRRKYRRYRSILDLYRLTTPVG